MNFMIAPAPQRQFIWIKKYGCPPTMGKLMETIGKYKSVCIMHTADLLISEFSFMPHRLKLYFFC